MSENNQEKRRPHRPNEHFKVLAIGEANDTVQQDSVMYDPEASDTAWIAYDQADSVDIGGSQ